MEKKILHVFCVPDDFDTSKIEQKVASLLGKNPVAVTRVNSTLIFQFDNWDEKLVEQQEKISHNKLSVEQHLFPIVFNDEIFSMAEVKMSFDLWQIVQYHIKDDGEIYRNLMKNVKMTRPLEDGPCIFSGTVSNLTKFEEKIKRIVGMVNEENRSSVAANTAEVESKNSSTVVQTLSHNDLTNQLTSTKVFGVSNSVKPKNFPLQNDLQLLIGKDLRISVFVGNIDQQAVGVIVNPVFEYKETSKKTKRNVAAEKPFVVGQANYYKAKNLPCKFVIDVCLPSSNGTEAAASNEDPKEFFIPILQNCYSNCLGMCKYLETPSIAFQPLGHQLFKDAPKASAVGAAQAMIQSIHQDSLGLIKEIRFVSTDVDVTRTFVETLYEMKTILQASIDIKILSPSGAGDDEKPPLSVPPGFDALHEQSSTSAATGEPMDTTETTAAAAKVEEVVHREECSICLFEFGKDDKTTTLDKCKHKFHSVCIQQWMNTKASCPMCQTRYGPPKGNQPPGQIHIRTIQHGSVSGFQDSRGYIEIHYNIPGGIQENCHPNPGIPFSGTRRTAYLPNNAHGNKIAKLLKIAFDCGLIFTVGTSVTTGVQNTVVWNGIHHKTVLQGGPFGYPDATYLQRVEEELRIVGIDESMLK